MKVFTAAMIVPVNIALMALRATVVSKIWLWLIVPHFHFEPLPAFAAFGISLIVGYCSLDLSLHLNRKTDNEDWAFDLWHDWSMSAIIGVICLISALMARLVLA